MASSPIDVAAALSLASEAGLAVTDLDGNPDVLPLDGLIVATPAVLAQVVTMIAATAAGPTPVARDEARTLPATGAAATSAVRTR